MGHSAPDFIIVPPRRVVRTVTRVRLASLGRCGRHRDQCCQDGNEGHFQYHLCMGLRVSRLQQAGRLRAFGPSHPAARSASPTGKGTRSSSQGPTTGSISMCAGPRNSHAKPLRPVRIDASRFYQTPARRSDKQWLSDKGTWCGTTGRSEDMPLPPRRARHGTSCHPPHPQLIADGSQYTSTIDLAVVCTCRLICLAIQSWGSMSLSSSSMVMYGLARPCLTKTR